MDHRHFDAFARWFAGRSSRRDVVKSGFGLAGAALLAIAGGARSADAASGTCVGKADGVACGGCGSCQQNVCVPNSDHCGFCGICDASLRCKAANDGTVCSSCGVCNHGACRPKPKMCASACETCRKARSGPVCESLCKTGENCCRDGHCVRATACCHGETPCAGRSNNECCPAGVACTVDGCCGSDGDTECNGSDAERCCHFGEQCAFTKAGAPFCCPKTAIPCGDEACCVDGATCLNSGTCCPADNSVCKHPATGVETCCDVGELCCNGVCRVPKDCCAQCGVCSTCDTSDPAKPKCVPIPAKEGKACGAVGCGGKCTGGACAQIADGEPCLNGQTCCGGTCKNSCGICSAGEHECAHTVHGENGDQSQPYCCPNADPCCPGNIFVKCGPNPETGACCGDKTLECGHRCCASGTLCDVSTEDGATYETCCPDGQAPCRGACCAVGQTCSPFTNPPSCA